MPTDPFVHLHVASGWSLRHGTATPAALVERAAGLGMDVLALTDRDGTYGAVRFVRACRSAGVRPVLGVDLAVEALPLPERAGAAGARGGTGARGPAGAAGAAGARTARRSPARGGAEVDPRHPRVVVLARGGGGQGWRALCRLVSATHLRGERGRPVTTLELVAEHAREGGLDVLLGPASDVARAVERQRADLARELLRRWRAALPPGSLSVEVCSHRGPGDSARAARLLALAAEEGVPAVLANAVRYLDADDAPVADVLDSARRLVPLAARSVDRVNAEGRLKSGPEMARVAAEVARLAGTGDDGRGLLAATRRVAERCVLDPKADLGLGVAHLPELDVLDASSALGAGALHPDGVLRARCEQALARRDPAPSRTVLGRLDDELGVIARLGFAAYFLTVADVVDLVRGMGVRCAARGSGAGSLVNHLLGVSGVDPLRHDLLMERFLSPLRAQLPDIDLDVESARRTEVYERILDRFGAERVACVSMVDTYRVRHAVRDVGAALGLPPAEIDSLAKAFPHIRARDARLALAELPELRASGIDPARTDLLLRLVERLDGLPRHVALHPCGVLLSDATLLDRTPVEASWLGFPMSQFDKDDVEEMGLLKLDVLGVRMQSAMAHAVAEVERVEGVRLDIDDQQQVPLDDPATFRLVQSSRTLGCFQIESPGQRELVGKFAPETFDDLVIDISLFRPGPVKSDMVTPFLQARQGWREATYLHEDLRPVLEPTHGVVVFHEQVLEIVATMTGCTLAEADEVRRALGDPGGKQQVEGWFGPTALSRGYDPATVRRVWDVLVAFASFGFCKAHAAAFALPTYQSAWLKAHHPAAFLAGVLTHDPGMYPKRLILDDARQFGIAVLPLDVNASDPEYRVERVGVLDEPPPGILGAPPRPAPEEGLPDGRAHGIRLGLADVKGISDAEVARIVAGRPYATLSDFWHRARVSRPVAERLVLAGAFDSLYGIGAPAPVRRRGSVTRRDLLLQVGDLDRWSRATAPPVRRGRRSAAGAPAADPAPTGTAPTGTAPPGPAPTAAAPGVRELAGRQSRAPLSRGSRAADQDVQLALDLGDAAGSAPASGLPEMTAAERVRAELEVLGLDASRHVVDFYTPLLDALGVTRSTGLLGLRTRSDVLVAGVKVATQTPPVRSGRRVVFVTLDDATGPIDATFFEDAQIGYATTLFHSWLLVVRGTTRRTGPRGISLQATGCWELPRLFAAWERGGTAAVDALLRAPAVVTPQAVEGAAASRSSRPVLAAPPVGSSATTYEPRDGDAGSGAGGMRGREGAPATPADLHEEGRLTERVLVHPSGFRQSPYADIAPAGEPAKGAPRKLWHASQGSSGW
ncbi:DNA polymerase III alpha subunit [Motilibacter rhizosphaerae]|uniref:DNA polymerase III subunit alpha n=1 Tax=Motilibacter rhizosphaerae TaxID=598652 RepID=A0A4Q7NGM0_9ACTN|nr:DNA polymerase III subunit alpha [Motilibacter rhizosphaerae]RZS82934.1 DNA polymerase III alpha subunit [Motilibacter rhizosphaerae]